MILIVFLIFVIFSMIHYNYLDFKKDNFIGPGFEFMSYVCLVDILVRLLS